MPSFPSAKGELLRYSHSAAACVAFEYDVSSSEQERGDDESSRTNATASPDAACSTSDTARSTPDAARSTSDAVPSTSAKKIAVVVVGGLTDGLFAVPYLQNLAELLREKNGDPRSSPSLSLVTPLMSSSHTGWGTGSLDRDASELLELAEHLASRRGCEGIVLVGHSTGCQDSIRFAERYKEERRRRDDEQGDRARTDDATTTGRLPRLRGVVLQAPVSDRECFFLNPETAPRATELLERAEKAYAEFADGGGEGGREGDDPGKTVIGFQDSWDGAPLSASRWRSLASRGGDDDMFSSDLTDDELEKRVGRHLRGTPTLVIASEKEQHLPAGYDTAAHARRLAAVINGGGRRGDGGSSSSPASPTSAEAMSLDGDHALYGAEEEAAEAIVDFVFRKCLC